MGEVLYRSRAPLRIGLAGGGTDVSPYSDIYGGAVLNATINMYAYATIKPRNDGKIVIKLLNLGLMEELDSKIYIEPDGKADLIKGVYNRIVRDFTKSPLSFEIAAYMDVPPGSGLGSSSTLVVATIGAFCEWLGLPLGEYDIAHMAYEIERKDLGKAGGKQDQYAAAFGGFNFMEFYNDRVIVNPLRVKREIINELEYSIILYYTGLSRYSFKIIEQQVSNVEKKAQATLEAMHELKQQAILMKEAILKGELYKIGELLDYGWRYKKRLAQDISNPYIDEIYSAAKAAGAVGGKISGAGGGGFMMFYCPGEASFSVARVLSRFGGEVKRFNFCKHGLETWKAGA